jgi:pilus assembly protein CpaF
VKDSNVTLEVQWKGQKPRLFRFPGRETTLGFHARCDLPLEPQTGNGAELSLAIEDGTCLAKPKRQPGAFQLNGRPCIADIPLNSGDVITTDSYRIVIRSLPTAFSGNDSKLESAPPADDATAIGFTKRGNSKAALPEDAMHSGSPNKEKSAVVQKKTGQSYLYLFFSPVQKYLEDDDVSEIMINGASQIFIERKGKLLPVADEFASERALQAAVMNVARSVGRYFDTDNPRLDARLPDGSRVHAVMPPLARAGTVVAIRKFRSEKLTLQQLVDFGSISAGGSELLNAVVKTGRNLIVSGATSSGKTSVLNVLSALIPDHDRILVLEDASELQLQQAHQVCFETRKMDEHGKGEVSIRDLLHSALRLRPDRIVVGEIRGGEALDLLQAMNTGHEGCMSTIHANNAGDSLRRLETCALLCGVELPLSALREQVASAIHVVIQTARLHDGTRKITGITEVLGLKESQYELRDIYFFKTEGISPDGKILGRHVFTGYEPSFLPLARQMGIEISGLLSK